MRRSGVRLALAFALTVAPFAGGALAAAARQEYWLVTSAAGTPYASAHTVHELQADGTRRVVRENRTLVEVFGQRQEVLSKADCVVNAAFEPVSCSVESKMLSGEATSRGVVEKGEFVVTLKRGELTLERRLPLADKPLLGICLPEILAARGNATAPTQLMLLDTDSWTLRRATATKLPDADGLARWSVEYEDGVGSGIWSFAKDGTVQRCETTGPDRITTRATAETAAQIKHWKMSDRELLTFPLKQAVPFPERLKSITVKLTWKDVPLEQLRLEDSRQRIVRQTHQGADHEVEIRLEQPATVAQPPALPVTDQAMAFYLGDETYIRPSHAAIQEQARQWTAGSQTTLDATQKLAKEVSSYLGGGVMIAETLSGPEVLACRKGKCAEFTTFFASLARSIGVPTRVALGMRLVAGQWMGHMWCEVWVGKWIPVDATAAEVGGSPALLKLTDSDTVQGTQRVRWAMTKSLNVEIVSLERDETQGPQLKTGIAGQTYTNADFACRITAPGDDWKLADRSTVQAVNVQFRLPGKFEKGAPQVNFVAFGLPSKVDPALLLNARKEQFKTALKGFELVDEATHAVGQSAGRRHAYLQAHPRAADQKIKTTEFAWTDDRSGYLLTLNAEESTHDAVLAQVEALLGRFESLAAKSAEAPSNPAK